MCVLAGAHARGSIPPLVCSQNIPMFKIGGVSLSRIIHFASVAGAADWKKRGGGNCVASDQSSSVGKSDLSAEKEEEEVALQEIEFHCGATRDCQSSHESCLPVK